MPPITDIVEKVPFMDGHYLCLIGIVFLVRVLNPGRQDTVIDMQTAPGVQYQPHKPKGTRPSEM